MGRFGGGCFCSGSDWEPKEPLDDVKFGGWQVLILSVKVFSRFSKLSCKLFAIIENCLGCKVLAKVTEFLLEKLFGL